MSQSKRQQFTVAVCRVGQRPTIEVIDCNASTSDWRDESVYAFATALVDGPLDYVRYPAHLGKRLAVIVNGQALLSHYPCNRWGLRGNCLICRMTVNGAIRSLTEKDVQEVMHDLEDESGYLAPGANVIVSVGFFFERGRSIAATDFEAQGNEWSPDLHFTGMYQADEVNFIEHLLDRYGESIVAHYIAFPYALAFSVQLQFGDTDEDQAMMRQCRAEYHDAFDEQGRLKPSVIKSLYS